VPLTGEVRKRKKRKTGKGGNQKNEITGKTVKCMQKG
jgi:hypothetical protein